MSRICEICGKTYQKGHLVPRGIGDRVLGRTITKKMPNLRSKKFVINGTKVKLTLCASCLKRIKRDQAEFAKQAAEEATVAVEAK